MTKPKPNSKKTDREENAEGEEEAVMAQAALETQFPTFEGLNVKAKYRDALEMMAYEGASVRVAADKHDIRRDNFMKCFHRPEVRKTYNSIISMMRDNATVAAYLRIQALSEEASSEHVRLEANKWIAGVGGLAPIKRVEGTVAVNHTFGGFDYGQIGKDVTPAHDDTSPDIDDAESIE